MRRLALLVALLAVAPPALALFAPVIWWNAAHGWASFIKQGGRTGNWHPIKATHYLGELLGAFFDAGSDLKAHVHQDLAGIDGGEEIPAQERDQQERRSDAG